VKKNAVQAVSGLLLAAGASKRMGTPKSLLPYGSGSVIEACLQTLTRSALAEVVVVVGAESDKVAAAVTSFSAAHSRKPPRLCVNPHWEAGMLSSVQAGLGAIDPGANAALIALVDQPALTAEVIDALLRQLRSDADIIVPTHRGRRGHPLIFSRRYFDEVFVLDPAIGLRALLRNHRENVREIAVETEAVLQDVDNPEDYRKAVRGQQR